MLIDDKLPEGYIVLCTESCRGQSFLVQNLGISIECPHCGHIALTSDLVAEFVERRGRKQDHLAA